MFARQAPARRMVALLLLALTASLPTTVQAQKPGIRLLSPVGVRRTTAQLMALPAAPNAAAISQARLNREAEMPDRGNLPQAPGAAAQPRWPMRAPGASQSGLSPWRAQPFAPQALGTSFTGATLADAGAFPPDGMGAVGPTQFVVFINGMIKSFNKTTGLADGVFNTAPDIFFSPVMTPISPQVLINFTSDPQVRYDRLTSRWFLTIIDVPCKTGTCSKTAGNRVLIAVSDAASAGVITPATVWTEFYFQTDPSNFLDYPSLGVDAKALYIGGNMFDSLGTQFLGCNGYVVNKASALGAGPLTVTAFPGMVGSPSLDGPSSPRGVDNFDPTSNEGYFIGNSNLFFGSLVLRRISDPGGTPTISPNFSITVNATSVPIPVAHLGNTGGNNGRLDAIDDRLFAAHIRNGRLWTAHDIGVTAAGVAGGTTGASGTKRDAVRWYELSGIRSTDNGGIPMVVESGTVFDTSATVTDRAAVLDSERDGFGAGPRRDRIQHRGHAVSRRRCDRRAAGGRPLGTLGSVANYTASSTAYNPTGNPGGASGRRWGDYSFTSLDPLDDMTMWTLQEFCNATNSYGVSRGQADRAAARDARQRAGGGGRAKLGERGADRNFRGRLGLLRSGAGRERAGLPASFCDRDQ